MKKIKNHILKKKPESMSEEDYQYKVYQDIMGNEELTHGEKVKLIGYLFGNKDVAQRAPASSTSTPDDRKASDPDPNVEKMPAKWKFPYSKIKTKDSTVFGKSGNDELARSINDIYANESLSDEEKEDRTLGLFKTVIDRDETASKRDEINGYDNILNMAKVMEDHLAAHPSGFDKEAPGFWQNALLSTTKKFGLILGQDELNAVDTINDLSSVLFIKAISGAAVTDKERAFLQGILTRVKDGHALNESTIQGMRHFVGRRWYAYYKQKLGTHDHAVAMTEKLMGGILPSGKFENGQFIDTPDEPFLPDKQDGRIGDIPGMKTEPKTEPKTTPPVSKAVPDKTAEKAKATFTERWKGYDVSQKRAVAKQLVENVGGNIAKARELLIEYGVDPDFADQLLGGINE